MLRWLTAPFRILLENWDVFGRTTLVALRATYAGSALGIVWLALGPVLLLALYALIYAVVFKVRPVDMSQFGYVLYVFSGLVPFIAFSTALNAGATALSANKEVLLSTMFPPELVPLRVVIANSMSIVVGLALICAISAAAGQVSWSWLLLPLFVVLQTMFVAGLVWVLSLLNLVMRDVQQMLLFLTIALLIVTPIAYTPSMTPASLKPVIYLNPLSYYVISFQHIIVHQSAPPYELFAPAAAISVASFCGAFWAFQKAKQLFFDFA